MNTLVSYDIENDRLRTKFSNQLQSLGLIRVQYSVFMGKLSDSINRKLEQTISKLTKEERWNENDAILLLPLHDYTKTRMQTWGQLPDDWDLINDPPHTLFL